MKHLVTLAGQGSILFGKEKERVAIDYQIEVFSGLGAEMNSAQGIIQGKYTNLTRAFNSDGQTVELQSGVSFPVLMENLSPDGSASIKVVGPIPGLKL